MESPTLGHALVLACLAGSSAHAQAPVCEQRLQALSQTLMKVGVATRPAALAAFQDAAAALRTARRESTADATRCERTLEPLLRRQALAARAEDHLHQNTPGAEALLALHRELFPSADRDGLIAFELGNCIADLTLCGCQGRKNDAARWRQVSAAYADARRAPEAATTQVRWLGKAVSLPAALDLGDARVRQALEASPGDGGHSERGRWPGAP